MATAIEGAVRRICELKEEKEKAVYSFVGGKDGFYSPADRVW